MKTRIFVLGVLLFATTLRAQLVADGATNVLSNLTNSITGTLTVGTNGPFTLLVLSNNCLVTNTSGGVIGRNAVALSNEVRLVSATAQWQVGGTLLVGSTGSWNSLVITGGAAVSSFDAGIGRRTASSNNRGLVTGVGSSLRTTDFLVVGVAGGSNSLEISRGGFVGSGNGSLGSAASGNQALVTDAGSVWSNAADMFIGELGSNNRLTISNAGWLIDNNGSLGSTNNQVVVTGSGSVWSNRASLTIASSGNQVSISNGGWVVNGNGIVGPSAISTDNQVVVAGLGSAWSTRTNLAIGDLGSRNLLMVSNSGLVSVARIATIGANTAAEANTVVVDGPGSSWLIASNLFVGSNGLFNRLVITNGGMVTNDWLGVAGNNAASKSNEIAVVGPGSTWRSSLTAYVGLSGSGNRMTISDGGLVTNSFGSAGVNDTASNNLAVVTGAGSLWGNSNALWIGSSASGNRLVVSNGGGAFCRTTGYLGVNATARSNVATITGPGSFWSYGNEMRVGRQGSGNTLIVSNGAWIGGIDGSIGEFDIASNNLAIVTGPNSSWTNLFNFRVGSFGSNNRLVVEHGGRIANDAAFIGAFGGRNEAFLTGPGTRWTSANELILGDSGPNNLLVVSNGAVVTADRSIVGTFLNASNNLTVVTGSGSMLSNAATLTVGSGSRENRFTASDGAVIRNNTTVIGASVFSSNNTVLVAGAGTFWATVNGLTVGGSGPNNRVVISNAATLYAAEGTIGADSSARSNSITVTDPGSTFFIPDVLRIGSNSPFNRLIITNGALVDRGLCFVGGGLSGSNNQVIVTGVGSIWTNNEGLTVGVSTGGRNQVVITSAGRVFASDVLITLNPTHPAFGFQPNEITVTDGGSLLDCQTTLDVGFGGTGSLLTVVSNGVVRVGSSINIGSDISTNNWLTVAAGTVRATNAFATGGLNIRNGTNIFYAGLIEVDQLWMTNAFGRFLFNGGTLITRGATISNGLPFVVGASGSTPAIWDVRAGSSTVLSDYLTVGNNTAFNQVFVTNGATPTNYAMQIGFGGSGRSNTVTIDGPGSRWTTGSMEVGAIGSQNSLLISNGAVVTCGSTVVGSGALAAGDQNQIVLTGIGSALNHSGDIIVGYTGDHNRVLVQNGATMRSASASIGVIPAAINNLALVTDPGSIWSNSGALFLGTQGNANQLIVSNGGWFSCSNALIGEFLTSTENLVLLSGPGSGWNNTGDLSLGADSAHNFIVVSNGAAMWSSNATFGRAVTLGIGNNSALITSAGTVWSNQNSLIIGNTGASNRLTVSGGAKFSNGGNITLGAIGSSPYNSFTLTGPGTQFYPGPNSDLTIGSNSVGCALVISNGAVADCHIATLGYTSSSSGNEFTLTGTGSILRSSLDTIIGRDGAVNRMTISDGASLTCATGMLGMNSGGFSNEVTVTGTGATWINRFDCFVGNSSPGNRLTITNGATVIVSNNLFLGVNVGSTNNLLTVDGGSLRVKNAAGTGLLDIARGKIVFNTGTMELDRLQILNSAGAFQFNGGTLSVENSFVNLGTTFFIGNVTNAATLILAGNGSHVFAIPPFVAANATLTGNGSIGGVVILAGGSTFEPGAAIGKIIFTNPPVLSGDIIMELSRSGLTLTNDQVQVLAPITYGGGTLVVTNIGPDAPVFGNSFKLFDATSYAGSFGSITLPELAPGLSWTNKLVVDGTIQVIGQPSPPVFTGLTVSGTNLLFIGTNGTPGLDYAVLTATNLTAPLSNWTGLFTNQFDAAGAYSFSNAITPGELQRYFRLRTP